MDTQNQDLIDINDWMMIQNKNVQENSTIMSHVDVGFKCLLHIDKNVPNEFVPILSRSAAPSENNTCARVAVADTIMGCIIGYCRVLGDSIFYNPKDKAKDKFRGGYEISEIPFEYCVKPNRKLVYDAERTGEKWLVSYNKKTLTYKPNKIGKLFVSTIVYTNKSGQVPRLTYTFYIQHNKDGGIMFNDTVLLVPGHYKAEWSYDKFECATYKDHKDTIVTPCSAGEYEAMKQKTAALLSYTDKPVPSYYNW